MNTLIGFFIVIKLQIVFSHIDLHLMIQIKMFFSV